ncbi:MAG: dTDP-glucose 4,6-dehydratase [Thermodesulfovibrionales bacterium]|nr:dTDP-glucose 4,6-dehydratase [Thermodesulfovibrionales bacterium]
MKNKMLITGGAGFIGSEFVRIAVNRGYEVAVVDCLTYAGDLHRIKEIEDKINFYHTSICNSSEIEEIFSKEKPSIVVHLAAESHVDRSLIDASPFIMTNIMGTKVLLEVSKKYDVNLFINVSTDEVYGDLGEDGQFTEETCLNPSSPYSVSKASQDMLGRAYFRSYGLPLITLRPSNNYGRWQYPEKLLPVVILKAMNDEKIPVYGKGDNVREWLHVSDCVRAIMMIIERGKIGEIYNIGGGNERKNIDVVKTVLDIMKKPHSLIEFVKDRPGHDFRYSLNSNKINSQIGWRPEIVFENGILDTVNWYIANIEWVNRKIEILREYWKQVYK